MDIQVIHHKKGYQIALEFLAIAKALGFVKISNPQILERSFLYRFANKIHSPKSVSRIVFGIFTLILIAGLTPLFQAFEAHIINVTATPAQIDPPILIPPGPSIAWNDTNGGSNLPDPITVFITAADIDATHLYYSFSAGTDPNNVPDPVCGTLPGGPKAGVYSENLSSDTVIKAVACDGSTALANHSQINTKIYTFAPPPIVEEQVESVQLQVLDLEETTEPEGTTEDTTPNADTNPDTNSHPPVDPAPPPPHTTDTSAPIADPTPPPTETNQSPNETPQE